MGRKKARRSQVKPTKKGRGVMENRFNCPECSNENVVQCRVDKKLKRGTAFCTICEATFGCAADSLTCPIDIYSVWIDELSGRK